MTHPVDAGEGNILWDCITVLDADTGARIRELGGIRAIAISHPHFYSRMADWAQEFGAAVYVHEADRQWVMQPSERVQYWAGARCQLLQLLSCRKGHSMCRRLSVAKMPMGGPCTCQGCPWSVENTQFLSMFATASSFAQASSQTLAGDAS